MSAFCTLNGSGVFQADIAFPRVGCWHADVLVAEDTAPADGAAVTLAYGSSSWAATVYRGGAPFGAALLRLVGGAGGLGMGKRLGPQSYQGCPLSVPLNDILSGAGERLSPDSDPTVLGYSLSAWTRAAGAAGPALTMLLEVAGASWRMRPDGSVWVGLERWPASVGGSYTLLEDHAQHGYQIAYGDDPAIQPGQTIGGRQISYVEHHFSEDKLRTQLWYEDAAAGSLDRIKDAFRRLVRAMRPVDYFTKWSGVVVSQDSTRKFVDFQADDPRIGGMQAVPLYWGEPGVDVEISTPARALLGFANGDPQKPYIDSFLAGTKLTLLKLEGGATPVAVEGSRTTGHTHGTSALLTALATAFTAQGSTTLTGTLAGTTISGMSAASTDSATDTVATGQGAQDIQAPAAGAH